MTIAELLALLNDLPVGSLDKQVMLEDMRTRDAKLELVPVQTTYGSEPVGYVIIEEE